jgi:2-methylcitrate dehydratase PrpD
MDIAALLAQHACATHFEDLPKPAVQRTKDFILDTLGSGIAGSSADGIEGGLQLVREIGGKPQATVVVFGDRVPATSAALINGAMFQARDFDPVYEPGVMLPYGPVLGAALAGAELVGASGEELITAVVLGTDASCRISKGLVSGLGWSRTATLGVFGAAMACARLLQLNERGTVNALGLALSQSAGNIQTVIDGSLAKRYQSGFAAEAGLKAALLASQGITGPTNVFEGRCGYFNLYESGKYQREVMLDGLGERYEGAECSIKPYPCSREHHGAIAAALQLHEGGVRVSDIESVQVCLPPNAFALSGKPYPRSGPHTIGAAISSAAYGTAIALIFGKVTLADYEEGSIARSAVLDLTERIAIEIDPSIDDPRALVPQTTIAVLRSGEVREVICAEMPGSPAMPLDPKELSEKFTTCVSRSALGIGPERAHDIKSAVMELESARGSALAFISAAEAKK